MRNRRPRLSPTLVAVMDGFEIAVVALIVLWVLYRVH